LHQAIQIPTDWVAVVLLSPSFAALTAAPAAFAADMPAPAPVYTKEPVAPPASWTGFYLGAGLGSRSANVSEQTLSAVVDGFNAMDSFSCRFILCGTTQSLDHTTFRFSSYFGYNWQIGLQWLVGHKKRLLET
jgi:opacity protein-like surface antigen